MCGRGCRFHQKEKMSYHDGRPPTNIALTVGFAVVGYISTAMHTLRAQQHRARVERVNEQLKCLYGPLLACVTASKSSYNAMLRQAARDGIVPSKFRESVRAVPDGPAAIVYRSWVKAVLMPLSERAAQLVITRADLLEGSGIEPLLLQLVSHVSAYKVILQRWEEGSSTDFSAIPYPDDIHVSPAQALKPLTTLLSRPLALPDPISRLT